MVTHAPWCASPAAGHDQMFDLEPACLFCRSMSYICGAVRLWRISVIVAPVSPKTIYLQSQDHFYLVVHRSLIICWRAHFHLPWLHWTHKHNIGNHQHQLQAQQQTPQHTLLVKARAKCHPCLQPVPCSHKEQANMQLGVHMVVAAAAVQPGMHQQAHQHCRGLP